LVVIVQEDFMFITSPFFVLCSSLVLFFVLIVFIYRQKSDFFRTNKALKTQLEAQDILLNELQSYQNVLNKKFNDLNKSMSNQNLETVQVSKQLEHRIKTIQKEYTQQKQLLEQFQNQQPQDKLYSRAFKLVELGADIEEVVRECDMPLAEAEMLISIHRNKTDPS
jgi:ribosome-binding ATPase YchF (GTP1/OBG family)